MKSASIIDKTDTLENLFAKGLVSNDRDVFLKILGDHGTFIFQSENLDTKEVGKKEFIDWILIARKEVEELSYYFDRCTFCKIGNPVVIFNNGYFPKKAKDNSEKERTGLMIVIKNNKITQIDFCYSFLETNNSYVFEKNIEKKLNKYMKIKNCTKEQAEQDFRNDLFIYCDFT